MNVDWQYLAALLLVFGCAGYAVWTLMPGRWRLRLRAALGLAAPASGSGCGGCDGCGTPPPRRADATARRAGAEQVVRVSRRPPSAG